MKTLGTILKEERLAKRLTLDDVASATKIRKKFLEAIEADDYAPLPSVSYAKGFVKNYSEYLGLQNQKMLAFFRRQTKDIPRSSLLPKGVTEPLNPTLFQLTPGRFLGLIIVGLILLFVLNLTIQYRKLTQPPDLIIDRPKNGGVVNDRKVEVIGRTDPDATMSINGVSVLVRGDGKFFDTITLENGPNTLTITATSRFGKSIIETRLVTLE